MKNKVKFRFDYYRNSARCHFEYGGKHYVVSEIDASNAEKEANRIIKQINDDTNDCLKYLEKGYSTSEENKVKEASIINQGKESNIASGIFIDSKENLNNEKLNELLTEFRNMIQKEKYAVYCFETKSLINISIVKSYKKIGYFGGADRNGYAQGQLIESIDANVDPSNGIFSDRAPLIIKLKESKTGEIITIKGPNNLKYNYCVLYIPKDLG